MDTRNTKRSKIELKASDNDNPGNRWKGSLPTEDLSDLAMKSGQESCHKKLKDLKELHLSLKKKMITLLVQQDQK